MDPSGNSWFSKLIGAIAGTFTFIFTGNPALAAAAFSFFDTGVSAMQAGVPFGQSLALAATNAVFAAAYVAAPWLRLPLGAAAGAADAAILGGDPGQGAQWGTVGSVMNNLFGPIIGGGITSQLSGGKFSEGASEGFYGIASFAVVGVVMQQISNLNNRTASAANDGQSGTPKGANTSDTGTNGKTLEVQKGDRLPFKDAARRERVGRTLENVKKGGPFPYPKKDGTEWGNWNNDLPTKRYGYYHEYTVTEPGAIHRGVERLVVGENGEVYYSYDHYKKGTFVQIDDKK